LIGYTYPSGSDLSTKVWPGLATVDVYYVGNKITVLIVCM
jgi:hypothetical protein